MAGQIVTLYIDDTSIRLLVARGKHIKKWARLSLLPGQVQGSVIIKEAEVAEKIKELIKSQKVNTRSVIVGLSGLHSLTRPIKFSALPKARVAEAVLREAKKVLPVSLEQLYVSWQSGAAVDKKTQVFMVAVPRRTVDSMLSTLDRAGLKPYLLDIKPLALTRAVREPTCIILDIQPTEFDIVIMSDGIPQPLRTVPLHGEDLSVAEKLATIANDIKRTVEFFNSTNPGKPLSTGVPLYISGELSDLPELSRTITEKLGNPIFTMPRLLPYPDSFDQSYYLPNICLLLKELSLKAAVAPAANVNALPEAKRVKPFSLARAAAIPLAATMLAVIVPMVILLQGTSANISSMKNQLVDSGKFLGQKNVQEQQLKNEIATLEKRLLKTETTRDNLIKFVNTINMSHYRVNGDLQVTRETLPDNIRITRLSYGKGTMTISGRAPGQADILFYARKLSVSSRFPEVIIASVVKIENRERGEGMEFIIILKGW